MKENGTGYSPDGVGKDACAGNEAECGNSGSPAYYSVAVLAQRSERLIAVLAGGLSAEGINADVTAYTGEKCDVLAVFDTRFPVRRITPEEGCIPILYSGSGRARRALSGCGLKCVSCGTAAYDTVTVSSIAKGSAMLTVQRELDTVYGGVIEPCEIPVKFSGCDLYKALLCAAVVLVCGGVPERGEVELRPIKK